MPGIARLGDQTVTWGDTIVSASPNVLVNGIPAARMGDAVTGFSFTIVKGSMTVLVNGIPVARLGDPTADDVIGRASIDTLAGG